MPVPSSINDLSTTAGTNSPAGSESPGVIDDYLRTLSSFIAVLRDRVQPVSLGGTGAATAAGARAALGASAVGSGVFTAADAAAARTALGASTVGNEVFTAATQAAAIAAIGGLSVVRSHLAGLTLSTAGSSTTMTVAAGQAADAGSAVMMSLASAISKTTSAWAVGTGNGGLDTGTIANNGWYHFYLIRRPDTGVVDVCLSASASAPTLPTNYTQYRRIGAGRTNSSGQWTNFVQDGDLFQWETPVLDVDAAGFGTAAVTRTLSVPPGVRVKARFTFTAYDAGNANQVQSYFSDLSTADIAPSTTAAPLSMSAAEANNNNGSANVVEVMTNTISQIRSRLGAAPAASGTLTLRIATLGWIDNRGRND